MKLSKQQRISLKVIMLFTTAIFSTFISDYLHEFFGDWKCQGSGRRIIEEYRYEFCNYGLNTDHIPQHHWGYRHWLYFIMCMILFIIQACNVISFANNTKND